MQKHKILSLWSLCVPTKEVPNDTPVVPPLTVASAGFDDPDADPFASVGFDDPVDPFASAGFDDPDVDPFASQDLTIPVLPATAQYGVSHK